MNPLLSQLKSHTQLYHERLETRLDIFNRVDSTEDYRALIARFYGFYQPVESHLAAVVDIHLLDFENRRKTPNLECDLHLLGVTDPNTLPLCDDLPVLETLPQAVGCLYVLEGATLGGQIISRQLRPRGYSCAFFSGYGDRVGMMWRAFGESARQYEGDTDVVLASACDTFVKIEAWLLDHIQ